jgi:hypothetical protein
MYKGMLGKLSDVPAREVTPMAWLKSALGLPETASWLGFGIQRLQDERFLVASGKKAGEWTEAVGADNGFLGWREVETLAASMSGVTIVLMFDMGDCVKVFPAR